MKPAPLKPLTAKQVQRKAIRLAGAMRMLRDEMEALQEQCPHEHLVGKYKGNTGNWCPQDDSYWIDAHCKDCNKRWLIDSEDNAEEYRTFKGEKDYGY